SDEDIMLDDVLSLGSIDRYEGQMSYSTAFVTMRLAALSFPADRTHPVVGYLDQTMTRPDLPEQISFAYVDFDFYKPIRQALEFLAGRLQPGGWAVIDDYGHFSSGAKAATDEFV